MYNDIDPSIVHLNYLADVSTRNWTDGSTFKIVLPVATAILGFLSSYALELIRRKREPKKQLSWDLETDSGIVAVSPSVRERVQVLYRDKVVDNLHALKFTVSNTGNRVVKNQFIRFEFNLRMAVLEADLDPTPAREIGVSRVDAKLPPNEIRYNIQHLERGQRVSFVFLAAGEEVDTPALHPFNEEGDVQFVQRDFARDTADAEHVGTFFVLSLMFVTLPPMTEVLIGKDSELGGQLDLVVRAAILIAAVPHISAIANLLRRIAARAVDKREVGNVAISGDALVMLGQNAKVDGTVSFTKSAESKAGQPNLKK